MCVCARVCKNKDLDNYMASTCILSLLCWTHKNQGDLTFNHSCKENLNTPSNNGVSIINIIWFTQLYTTHIQKDSQLNIYETAQPLESCQNAIRWFNRKPNTGLGTLPPFCWQQTDVYVHVPHGGATRRCYCLAQHCSNGSTEKKSISSGT